jgi:hypothetical protein
MESSAAQQNRGPVGGPSVSAGVFDPAVALCRDGEIIWSSEGLAELLALEGASLLEGRPMLELLD